MGVSLLILIIAFLFLRRRKARKHTHTIGADIMVTGPQDIELTKGEVGSSASSMHSEQLPPYAAREET
jgi:hypothetical protein